MFLFNSCDKVIEIVDDIPPSPQSSSLLHISHPGTDQSNDFTTSWVKFTDAAPNGTFQCHECDTHISSKKAIKTHLSTAHSKELDEKEGSVLQVLLIYKRGRMKGV